MTRRIILYDQALKQRAKELRQNMTHSEKKLWERIKNKQVKGYDFDRQRPIGNYIVDFYCKDLGLALEVDGITHMNDIAKGNDEARQEILEDDKVHFLRFDALIVLNHIDDVIKEIENWIEKRE